MTRYQQLDLSRYNSAVIFLQYPLGKSLDELSLASFNQGIYERLGYTDIRFGIIGIKAETTKCERNLVTQQVYGKMTV